MLRAFASFLRDEVVPSSLLDDRAATEVRVVAGQPQVRPERDALSAAPHESLQQ